MKHVPACRLLYMFIVVLPLTIIQYSCSNNSTAGTTATNNRKQEYTVAAVLYHQQSGEWRALSMQAFQLATLRVKAALSKPHKRPLAIISDLDETLLDNSAFQAQLAIDDSSYTDSNWHEWSRAKKAKAMPGAREFLDFVTKNKVAIFYVTNRDSIDLPYTIENMAGLGYPQDTASHFKVYTDKGNKQARREAVMKDYDVILQLGDNLNDFSGAFYHKNYKERKSIADSNATHFGVDYIVLPNPLYGDWEGALYSTPNHDSIRHALLEGYK